MGLTYDLTLPHPDLTPIYVKALSGGVYAEQFGDSFNITANTGTIDTKRYWEYDASVSLNGVNQFINVSTTHTANLEFNQNDKTKAGYRLISVYLNDVTTTGIQGLYQWYLDANNFEVMYLDIVAGVVTLTYKVTVAGVVIYNLSAVVTVSVGWNVFQAYSSYTGANRQVGLLSNGVLVVAMTNDATAGTTVTFAGTLEIGRVTLAGVNKYLNGYFDTFITRRSLMFSLSWTDQPTDPAWQDGGATYITKTYTGGPVVTKDLGTLVNIAPSIFAENSAPQGIPDFVIARDVMYVVGVGNFKIYKPVNHIVKPDPATASLAFQQNARTSFFNILYGVAVAAGGTIEAATWLYAISLVNTKTGEETELSDFVGSFVNTGFPTTGYSTDNPVATLGASVVNISVWGADSSSFYDRIKVYRKRTSDNKVFYVGMGILNSSAALTAFRTTANYTTSPSVYTDNFATALLQEIPHYATIGSELICVDTLGLPKPGAPTVAIAGGVLQFPAGDYYLASYHIDPRTGTRSGLGPNNATTIPAGPTQVFNVQGNTTLASYQYRLSTSIRGITLGEQGYTNYETGGVSIEQYAPAVTGAPSLRQYLYNVVHDGSVINDVTLDLPKPCNYVEHHDDRNWYACFGQAKNKVMFSEVDQLELVSDNNYFIIGNDSESITGLASFYGVLVVFKEHSTWIITGNSPDNYQYQNISKNIGCVAHRSIQVIDNALYFCAVDGPHIYDGSSIFPINESIQSYFQNMNARMRPMICSAVDREYNLYLLGIRYSATQSVADSLDTIYYNYNTDKILAYNYKHSDVGKKEFNWTILNYPVIDMDSGYLLVNRRSNVLTLNTIPNSGDNPGTYGTAIGFFNVASNADFGNWSTNNVSWSVEFNLVSHKVGRNNLWNEINFIVSTDNITTGFVLTAGVKANGASLTSAFNLVNGDERFLKKLSVRSKYISAVLSGNNAEEFRLLGYEFKGNTIGIR